MSSPQDREVAINVLRDQIAMLKDVIRQLRQFHEIELVAEVEGRVRDLSHDLREYENGTRS